MWEWVGAPSPARAARSRPDQYFKDWLPRELDLGFLDEVSRHLLRFCSRIFPFLSSTPSPSAGCWATFWSATIRAPWLCGPGTSWLPLLHHVKWNVGSIKRMRVSEAYRKFLGLRCGSRWFRSRRLSQGFINVGFDVGGCPKDLSTVRLFHSVHVQAHAARSAVFPLHG